MAAKKIGQEAENTEKLDPSNSEDSKKLDSSIGDEIEEDEESEDPDVVYLSMVTIPVQIVQPWRRGLMSNVVSLEGSQGIQSLTLDKRSGVVTLRFTRERSEKPVVFGQFVTAQYLSHGGGPVTNKGGRPRGRAVA